ncbi:MAG TPA: Holliday junction resolvase RuvX [Candidatus Paceibacterota bacterium]|nr:Holliday junction resolvase RuvX [Candidatus Paceibacterota bacterium]
MRYLGIDFGAKRIGIALSDETGGFAFPKETIPNDDAAFDHIAKLIDANVGAIVIGDARAANGVENPVTFEADHFAERLGERVTIPIHRAWEAWSSVEAGRFAPNGVHDDSAAAAIILQRFLDARGKTE